MKSSPSTTSGQTALKPQAWIPASFAPVQPVEAVAVNPEEILAILSSAAPSPAKGNPANGKLEVGAWMPADLGSPRPAPVKPAWKTMESREPVSEKNYLRKEAELAAAQIMNQAHQEADEIVKAAEAKAQMMLEQAQQKADELTLQAHQEGWSAAEAETAGMLSTVQEIVHQTQAWREDMLAQSESSVLDLVREMAKVMFHEGYVLDPEALQITFNRILTNARSLGDLRIYVNPEDAANLDPYWREFQVSIVGHQVQIIPSDSIRRGGCFVDGQWGSIDARIETQLKAILDTLSDTTPAPISDHESSAD